MRENSKLEKLIDNHPVTWLVAMNILLFMICPLIMIVGISVNMPLLAFIGQLSTFIMYALMVAMVIMSDYEHNIDKRKMSGWERFMYAISIGNWKNSMRIRNRRIF